MEFDVRLSVFVSIRGPGGQRICNPFPGVEILLYSKLKLDNKDRNSN